MLLKKLGKIELAKKAARVGVVKICPKRNWGLDQQNSPSRFLTSPLGAADFLRYNFCRVFLVGYRGSRIGCRSYWIRILGIGRWIGLNSGFIATATTARDDTVLNSQSPTSTSNPFRYLPSA